MPQVAIVASSEKWEADNSEEPLRDYGLTDVIRIPHGNF